MADTTVDYGRDDGLITSLDNPTIRFARNLQRRRFRYRERAVLVEGERAIRTAVQHGAAVRALLVDGRLPAGSAVAADDPIVAAAERVLTVAGPPFDSVVDTEHPQPLVAVCRMPDLPMPAAATLALALDGVRDPGNLGTLIRTAAAASVEAVVLLPGCVDPFNPKTVRASAGLVFAVPVGQFPDLAAVTERFAARPTVALADAEGDLNWDRHDWTGATLLVLGGEATGASETTRTYADIRISLPMAVGVESLNVAAAGAALLFECVRQRMRAG